MDIATLERISSHLTKLLDNEGSTPSAFKNGLKLAQREIHLMVQNASASLTLVSMQDRVTEVPLKDVAHEQLRVVAQEDGTVVAVTIVDADNKIQKILWERVIPESNEVPEPPGRYHINPNNGEFEVCDTAIKVEGHPLGEVVGRFKRRDMAWAALMGLNMDNMTRRKVEYLMATPKAKPVGVILVLPNLSRAYVDMGRVEWNTIPAHNPLSIRKDQR